MSRKQVNNFAAALALATMIAQSAGIAQSVGAQEPVRFVEESARAGLAHTYGGTSDFVVGGGAAVFDCDGDGLPELFLAGGAHGAAFFRNQSTRARGLKFARATARLGVARGDLKRVTGAYPLDIDNDGRLDLFVLRFGRNLLLRGTGDCRFEPAGAALGLPQSDDWTTAFAAIWEAGYTLPTLAVGNYVNRARPLNKTGNCDSSYLLRGKTPRSKTYAKPLELGASCALSMLFVDWANTGKFDLRVANDRQYFDPGTTEQLWRLAKDGPRLITKSEGWNGPVIWGMGLAARDLDGDARPEIAVTNMADNRLEKLVQPGSNQARFENAALAYNTMSQRPYFGDDKRPSTSWHVQ
ncbi:MAG: FG-GAP repeat domain-containing protein, partial [Alphaproteobacteria bacterium]